MDPYKQKEHLRRLGKKRGKHLKIVEASVTTIYDEATILEVVVIEEPDIPHESKKAHTVGLRKQIIKTLAVFLAFFTSILLTLHFVTHGHPFVMIIAIALGLSLSLPFFIYLTWVFIKLRFK